MKNYGFNFQNSYKSLPDVFYKHQPPVAVANPHIVILNEALAANLGLNVLDISSQDQAALFSGNYLPEEAEPLAQAYAGHQFGHFTMLGDGRAVTLGEHITTQGDRFEIQFKGSGRTPYSRGGDGRAVLGPMLREYIISEAMHALGIPTTRSLSVVTTGENVIRQKPLPGAILTRVASSYIRVGTFEFAARQADNNALQALLDYTINRHAPELNDSANPALALLTHVIQQQLDLVIHWMRVGFIHGVMNTDNMALSGETIDYGPCAFMDDYDPATVFSSIDQMGRYAYANQPVIAQWNIARLAESLLPLIDDNIDKAIELAEEEINKFPTLYKNKSLAMMRAKLGLFGTDERDEQLISDLLDCMQKHHMDYTNTFRDLACKDKIAAAEYNKPEFLVWYKRWLARLEQNQKPLKSSYCLMKNTNPAVIPRNHLVESALQSAEAGEFNDFYKLLRALKTPYKEDEFLKPFQSPPVATERVYQTFCGT